MGKIETPEKLLRSENYVFKCGIIPCTQAVLFYRALDRHYFEAAKTLMMLNFIFTKSIRKQVLNVLYMFFYQVFLHHTTYTINKLIMNFIFHTTMYNLYVVDQYVSNELYKWICIYNGQNVIMH